MHQIFQIKPEHEHVQLLSCGFIEGRSHTKVSDRADTKSHLRNKNPVKCRVRQANASARSSFRSTNKRVSPLSVGENKNSTIRVSLGRPECMPGTQLVVERTREP